MELGPGVDAQSSQGGESCCILERDGGNVEIWGVNTRQSCGVPDSSSWI